MLEAAFASNPTDASQVYTDITPYLRDDSGSALHMARGRTEDTKTFNAGRLTALLDNRARTFDQALHSYVQSEKAIRYSLEYPWLPGLVPNSGFGSNTGPTVSGWVVQGTGGSLTSQAGGLGVSYDGGVGFARCSVTSGTGGIKSTAFPVSASSTYVGSVRLRPSATCTGKISVAWFSGAGGGGSLLRTDVASLAGLTANAWNRVAFDSSLDGLTHVPPSAAVSPPGTAVSCVVTIQITGGSTITLDVDDVVFDVASFQDLRPQWVGYADSWACDQEIGDATCSLSASDGFKALGFKELNSASYISLLMTGLSSGAPTYHWRLSDSGQNNVISSFVNYVTGDRLAHSTIDHGVGPLYNVAGALITEVDGAFSSLGPSSSDWGHLVFPPYASIDGLLNYNWAVNVWYRSPAGDIDPLGAVLLSQGAFGTTLTYWFIALAPNGEISFFLLDAAGHGVSVGIDAFTSTNWGDQVPHQISVRYIASTKVFSLLVDGVVVGTDAGTATQATMGSDPIELLGLINTSPPNALYKGEVDEFSVWLGAAPSDADFLALWNRARRLYPTERSDTRIGKILDLVGWPAALRSLDVGSSNVVGPSVPFSKANPLQYLQQIEASELGWLFMDKNGAVNWTSRWNLYADRTSLATFGNGAGEVPYEKCIPVNDNRLIINDAQYAGDNGGALQEVQDATSIGQFWFRSDSASDLVLTSDEQVNEAAQWVVDHYKAQTTRIEQMTLNPAKNDTVMSHVMQREFADLFTVRVRPVGGAGATVDYKARLLGIDHTVKRGKLTVVWNVSTAYAKDYFLFGDVFGSEPMGW